MAKTSLSAWEGTGIEKFETWSDYDRACEVEDYVGLIKVGDDEALVLGDMPSNTARVVVDSSAVLFIRWIWADDENQVVNAMKGFSIAEQDWAKMDLEIRFPVSDIVLFDSSYPGEAVEEMLEMTIEPGVYKPQTLSYEPSPATNLFLILLQKTPLG